VTFDPFGDFATEGYLCNFDKEKDRSLAVLRAWKSFDKIDLAARSPLSDGAARYQ
jgi:hypothetical protein